MEAKNIINESLDHQHDDIELRYQRFRDAGVAWWPEMKGWAVSRYEDVRRVLSDHENFSSDVMNSAFFGIRPGEEPSPELIQELAELAELMPYPVDQLAESKNIIAIDPPDHASMRSLVSRVFLPRRITSWENRIHQIVQDLVNDIEGKNEFDLVKDFANPLPTVVVAEILGVEPDRQEQFKHWSDILLGSLTGIRNNQSLRESGFIEAASSIANYLAEQVADREKNPRDDVISLLVDETYGPRLSAPDAVSFAQLLLVAGNETTTHLIASICRYMVNSPQLVQQLQQDDQNIANFIEEVLRLDSPTQLLYRRARKDIEIEGQKIAENDIVVALLGSANRDPQVFQNPACLDITREVKRGQTQTAFGYGPHFCIGAALARMEATIAIKHLLPLVSRLKLQEEEMQWADSYVMRGYSSLPVCMTD